RAGFVVLFRLLLRVRCRRVRRRRTRTWPWFSPITAEMPGCPHRTVHLPRKTDCACSDSECNQAGAVLPSRQRRVSWEAPAPRSCPSNAPGRTRAVRQRPVVAEGPPVWCPCTQAGPDLWRPTVGLPTPVVRRRPVAEGVPSSRRHEALSTVVDRPPRSVACAAVVGLLVPQPGQLGSR